MKRTLIVIGSAVIAAVGAVAASQAQGPENAQRGGPPVFDCGPERGPDAQGPPPQGAIKDRGPGGARQGGIGRPGGPGGRGGPGRGGRGNPLCALDLTEEQQTQIAAIQKKAQEDIEAVLTPEQREKLSTLRGGRGPGRH